MVNKSFGWLAGILLAAGLMASGCVSSSVPAPATDATDQTADVPVATELPAGTICVPAATQCVGSNFLVCDADGEDWSVTVCPTGEFCTSTGCGVTACPPNEAACDGEIAVKVCRPDGSGYGASTPCSGIQTCRAGQCIRKECKEGENLCVKNVLLVCEGEPVQWTEYPCGPKELCFQGDCVECFSTPQCPTGMECDNGHCVSQMLGVTTPTLPDGQIGVTYAVTLVAAGGEAPYAWALLSGTLPDGLLLTNAGIITGIPTEEGTSSFKVSVTDSLGMVATADLSIIIHAGGLMAISTLSPLPGAQEGEAYSVTFAAVGGTAPLGWMITTGKLPAGLTMASNGILSGTPTESGAFGFTVRVVDSSNPILTASADFDLVVGVSPLEIVGDTELDLFLTKVIVLNVVIPIEGVPVPYSVQLQAKGGKKPYAWTEVPLQQLLSFLIPNAGLPTGLALGANGQITGFLSTSASAVELTVPFANITLKGFFFMAQVADAQSPSETAQAVFLIPTVPLDLSIF